MKISGALFQALQLDDPEVCKIAGVTVIAYRRVGFGESYSITLERPAKFRKDCEWLAYTNDTYGKSWKSAAKKAITAIDALIRREPA